MMRYDKIEDEALLQESTEKHGFSEIYQDTLIYDPNISSDDYHKIFWKRAWKVIVFHIGLVLLYCTSLLFIYRDARQNCHAQDGIYTPIRLTEKATVFQHEHSGYVGQPSPELDGLWDKLLLNFNMRITKEELQHTTMNEEDAIKLPDGGYYAGLTVYHDLHCIKRLHHYMYPEYYFPNFTQEQKELNEYHTHHCLDMLRQSIMCHGDTQLITMKWLRSATTPIGTFEMPHRCLDWDQLETWASSRRINNLMEPGYLYHPTLGPAYPGGQGDPVGELKGDSAQGSP